MLYRVLFLLLLIMIFAACGPTTSTAPQATAAIVPTATSIPATRTPAPPPIVTDATTSATILLPVDESDSAALELLSGSANTCSNAEDFGAVLGFEANYTELSAVNKVHYRLTDAAGNVLSEDDVEGENKNGQEGWGFYPPVYNVPENSNLTIEVTVFTSDSIATSRSVLTYNCTTGETIETTFTDNP